MTVPERCKALALLALEVSTEEGRVGRARARTCGMYLESIRPSLRRRQRDDEYCERVNEKVSECKLHKGRELSNGRHAINFCSLCGTIVQHGILLFYR